MMYLRVNAPISCSMFFYIGKMCCLTGYANKQFDVNLNLNMYEDMSELIL